MVHCALHTVMTNKFTDKMPNGPVCSARIIEKDLNITQNKNHCNVLNIETELKHKNK